MDKIKDTLEYLIKGFDESEKQEELGSSFFRVLDRLKYLDRWQLCRRTCKSSVMEHSYMTGIIGYWLACEYNRRIGGEPGKSMMDSEHVLLMGLFHDMTEAVTGDMPNPIKCYSQATEMDYSDMEALIIKQLTNGIKDDDTRPKRMYRENQYNAANPETVQEGLIKMADCICALMECLEEIRHNNREEFMAGALDYMRRICEFKDKDISEVAVSFCMKYLRGFGGQTHDIILDILANAKK